MKIKKIQIFSILISTLLLWGSMATGSTKDTQGSRLIVSAGISVVINEIHYNPGSVQGSDNDYEFAELYNNGSSPVDLTGWTFSGQSLDGITIAVDGYVIIAYTGATYSSLASATCSIVNVGGYFGLSNGGNTLDLLNGATLVDSVTYDDASPWSKAPDGGGPSLERIDPKFGSNNVTNWGASSEVGGSPCAQSTIHYTVDTFPEIISQTHRSWTPTAGSDVTFSVKATDNKAVSSVKVNVSSDNFVTNNTLILLDGDNDDVFVGTFTAGATGTAYTYGVTVTDNADQKISEWNNFMNFSVADVYPFISGFNPEGGDLEYLTLSFDGRGSASSYDLSGLEIVDGNNYLGNIGWYDSIFQFPVGSSMNDGETVFLAKNGTAFEAAFKFAADFEFNGSSSAINLIALELGGSTPGFDLSTGWQELALVKSGSVLDAVQSADWGAPNFRGDTMLSTVDYWSPTSRYGLAPRDNDDPENDFITSYFPYVRPSNVLNNSQAAPGALIELDIFDKDNISRVYASWDGNANTTLTLPYTTNVPTSDGSHVLTVFANESGGLSTLLSYVYTVSEGPVITLVSPANNAVIASDSSVSVSIVDYDGVSTVSYSWDGAANVSMTVEVDNTYDVPAATVDGLSTLKIFSSDTNGASGNAEYSFTIDGTNPVITLVSPTNNTNQDVGVVVDFTITDTNLASAVVSVNDEASTAFSSPYDYTLSTAGSVKLEITATDDAGNSISIMVMFTVIGDTTSSTPTSSTPTSSTPTSSAPTSKSKTDDSPGFVAIYILLSLLSLVQFVRFNKFQK